MSWKSGCWVTDLYVYIQFAFPRWLGSQSSASQSISLAGRKFYNRADAASNQSSLAIKILLVVAISLSIYLAQEILGSRNELSSSGRENKLSPVRLLPAAMHTQCLLRQYVKDKVLFELGAQQSVTRCSVRPRNFPLSLDVNDNPSAIDVQKAVKSHTYALRDFFLIMPRRN